MVGLWKSGWIFIEADGQWSDEGKTDGQVVGRKASCWMNKWLDY